MSSAPAASALYEVDRAVAALEAAARHIERGAGLLSNDLRASAAIAGADAQYAAIRAKRIRDFLRAGTR